MKEILPGLVGGEPVFLGAFSCFTFDMCQP